MKLKSIKKEAAACRKAFKGFKGKYVVHCHHQKEYEELTEPAENRIAYILSDKDKGEQALRLRLFRPIKAPALAEYKKITGTAWAEFNKITGTALAEYNKITDTASAEYKKITGTAWAEYNKITDTASAEYNKITGTASAEYNKKILKAHKIICKEKNCPWDGSNIF